MADKPLPPWASDPKADLSTIMAAPGAPAPVGLRPTAAAPAANVPAGSPVGAVRNLPANATLTKPSPPPARNPETLMTMQEKIDAGITGDALNWPYRWDENHKPVLPEGFDTGKGNKATLSQLDAAQQVLKATGVDLEHGIDPVAAIIAGSTSGDAELLGAKGYEIATGIAGGVGIGPGGRATSGMAKIARLATIANDMTLQMMPGGSLGNQISNTDRDFIAARMGDIANPRTPVNARLEAWDQVKKRLSDVTGIKTPEQRGILPYTEESRGEGGQLTAGTLQLPEPGQEQQAPGAPVEQPPQPIDPSGQGDIGFSGNVPPETINPLSPNQQAAYDAWSAVNKKPTAQQLISFFDSIGATINPANAKAIEEATAAGATQRPGSEAHRGLTEEQKAEAQAAAERAGRIGAAVKGASDTVTFGGADKLAAGMTALGQEGDFSENYQENLDFGNAYDEALQGEHPGWYTGGQIVGAAGIPLPSGVAEAGYIAAKEVLAAGGSRTAALQAARYAGAKAVGKEGAAYGGAYGAVSSDSLAEAPGNTVTGAVTGGLGGAGLGAFPFAAGELARTAPRSVKNLASGVSQKMRQDLKWIGDKLGWGGDDGAAKEVAQAAGELDINVPKYMVGGPKDVAKASALEKTPAGFNTLSKATNRMLDDSAAARDRIAGDLGTPATSGPQFGNTAVQSSKAQIKSARGRIGQIFKDAKREAGGARLLADDTDAALSGLIHEEDALGGSKTADILGRLQKDLAKRKGIITIDIARKTRSNLRTELRTEAGLTATDADRVVNHVMHAIGTDIERGLKAAGKDAAIPLYRKADNEWAAQRLVEDDVLKPYIGKDGENWGSDVARKLNEDAKGNGTRLALFLDAQPPEVADHIRASLIARLGRSKSGKQNAAGDKFSLDEFLTNWDQMKETRNLVFPTETVRALDNLAKVADAAKTAGASSNKSQTGFPAMAAAKQLGAYASITGALATQDWKLAAAAIATAGFQNMKQFAAAKLLASPAFAKRLAATPKSPKGAKEFWSRSLQNMARVNPEIESEILEFQKNVVAGLNDNEPSGDETNRAATR